MNEPVIRVSGLKKNYGRIQALKGVDFQVEPGEIFGIVGPNGAGKTTTIDCMSGMRRADSGEISVLGLDPADRMRALRNRIGLQQQESELPDRIRVLEALELFRKLFSSTVSSGELLDKVGLEDKADSFFCALSGGQKRRLFVALALINDPELILLDELTSGLDPRGRRRLWKLVEDFSRGERTVILSTHYMDEAQKLCDRIAVFNAGRVVALGSPNELIGKYCPGMRLIIGCGQETDTSFAVSLKGVQTAEHIGEECVMDIQSAQVVVPVIQSFVERGISPDNLRTETPSLEDVFMALTGREFQNEAE